MASSIASRAEAAALRAVMALPHPVMRRLAGAPVVLDGQTLDLETQWLLRVKRLTREPGVETLPVGEGRRALDRQCRLAGGRQPVGEVRDLDVAGGAGPVGARLYVPRALATGDAGGPAPLLVWFHGGGFVHGGLDSHDALCRLLAERVGARVVAVDYRLAPEHPFPAALDDCWAAYAWVAEHADRFAADPDRIAVGGDSAGGHLAGVVARRAAEAGVPCAAQLLVYPVANSADPSESRTLFREGFYLTEGYIALADGCYLRGADRRDPDVSLAYTEKIPAGLAPALVVTAGFDPLRDEGEAWARTLADAGADVRLTRYPGLVHGFFNVVGVGRSQRAAVAEVAARLRSLLHDDAPG